MRICEYTVSHGRTEARVLAPEFYAEVVEMHGDDLEPDGSPRKELWK